MKRLTAFAFATLLAAAPAHAQWVDLTANVQGVLPRANGGTGNNAGMPQAGTLGFADTGLLGYLQSNTNSYAQFVLQNSSAGAAASTDLVLTNNLSTATTFYGDLGINGAGFVGSGSLSLPSAVFLTGTSGELVLGTTTANGVHVVVNNGASDALAISATGGTTINGTLTAPGLLTTGTATASLCSDSAGHVFQSAGPCFPLATPIAGLLKGNGSTLAAAVAGTDYVAPGGALGTPSSGVATNLSGTAAGLTAGSANGLATASGSVVVNASAAPAAGQVLTATSATTAQWQAPQQPPLPLNMISGFGLSNDTTTPASILDIAAGVAVDSSNAVTISGSAFKKSTAGVWAAGAGGNGMGTGLTVAANTWYHVFAIVNGGAFDVYFDTSITAANKPAGTTAFRYIGSFRTISGSTISQFLQMGQRFMWGNPPADLSAGTATIPTSLTLTVPPGIVTFPLLTLNFTPGAAGTTAKVGNPTLMPASWEAEVSGLNASAVVVSSAQVSSNTASQVQYQVSSSSAALGITTMGYINPHVAPNF